MNIFDIIIILLIMLSGVMGLKKGVIKEVVVFLGTILVYVIAFSLKSKIGFLLCKWLPFFSFDGLEPLNILVYQLIAFILIASILFSIMTIVFKLTGIIQKLVDMTIILTLPSKILGFIVGVVEGYIILFILLIILAIPLRNIEIFRDSKLASTMLYQSPVLSKTLGGIPKAIKDISKISSKIGEKDTNKDRLALDIMKVELDYHIISKRETLELIEKKKLNKVSGIRSFVINYLEK